MNNGLKAISNYIAALITVTMIFTAIAFYITTSIRQVQISNYALNTMVEISERARENLALSSVINGQNITITIVNRGTLDTPLSHLVIVSKTLKVYEYTINGTTVPVGGIVNLRFQLPVPPDQIYNIMLITYRGNVFDVLSTTSKPLTIYITLSDRLISPGEKFNISIVIINNIGSTLRISPDYISIYFRNETANLTSYFVVNNVFPDETISIGPSQQVILTYTYEYVGGLSPTYVDIYILIEPRSIFGEHVYSSTYVHYCLKTT